MKYIALRAPALAVAVVCACGSTQAAGRQGEVDSGEGLRVLAVQPDVPICRAGRPTPIAALVENRSEVPTRATVRLIVPDGIKLLSRSASVPATLQDVDESTVTWIVEAKAPGTYRFRVEAGGAGGRAGLSASVAFLPQVGVKKCPYVPEPKPIATDILVGALNCPLWESDKPQMWDNILKHPERTPALGFYGQESPEVADWETKWAVEHGVSFFVYCWYRAGQGGTVKQNFGSAIEARLRSRFAELLKFAIMWENQARGTAGVSDEKDLFDNLFPFWLNTYFKNPSYLKIDGKPVLFIYTPANLCADLGGPEKTRAALDAMRRRCVEAGFAGLTILGEYRGLDPDQFAFMKSLGLDATFPYCLSAPAGGSPEQIVQAQTSYARQAQDLGVLPKIVTASQAWSGWNDEGPLWKLPPAGFETLLRESKKIMGTLPAGQFGSRMLLLDNWNEWGEGHYIAPYREYGFGYLDAVRKVFSGAPEPHVDLIPEDVGLGPYDTAFRENAKAVADARRQATRKTLRPGGDDRGLIGWWTFDEKSDSPVALDYAGHRLGGVLRKATRAEGIRGRALVCDGGCVVVRDSPLLSPSEGLSVECWVKTDVSGQNDKWFVNRVLGGGASTGYRMGLVDGRPCFEVPQTDWSHSLVADAALPLGRWVQIVGTCDGETLRLYVDGRERAAMKRQGPIKANGFPLCLGSYDQGHPAHFSGLLDEVRIYDRALTADEVAQHCLEAGGG